MSICDNCVHLIICDHDSSTRRSCGCFEECRPHGEWINERFLERHGLYFGKCSQCGKTGVTGDFCPNCGADMRKEGEVE